ncbi:MAG: HAD family phosphatase [Kiloniellales bacterium]|nr:HAD family phosphatase [Kiloniellales bacterium]
MPRCRAVVFDLGGVLCGFDPPRRLAAISKATGLTQGDIKARIWDSGFDRECDEGRFTLKEIFEEFPRRLGTDLPPEKVTSLYFAAFPEWPEVIALVDRLHPAIRRAILTNNGPLVRHGLPLFAPNVFARFPPEDICLASDFGDVKPAAEVYDGMAAHLGIAPGELFFIDDSEKNAEGARVAGWSAHHFSDAASLKRILLELQLLLG